MNERRIKILQLLADGKVPKEIAAELGITVGRVRVQEAAIRLFLHGKTNENAVKIGIERGYIQITLLQS